MVKERLCFKVCDSVVSEVRAVIAAENLTQVDVESFQVICTKTFRRKDFENEAPEVRVPNKKVRLLTGSCFIDFENTSSRKDVNSHVKGLGQCYYLLAPKSVVDQLTRDGAYIVTAGWLENWRLHVTEEWGFSEDTAREFFAESCSRLVLLDTGISDKSAARLSEMAGFVGRPFEIFTIGLDYCRLCIKNLVLDWNLELEKAKEKERANYVVALEMMDNLANSNSEAGVIDSIFEVFHMLFMPGSTTWLSVENGQPGEIYCSPCGSSDTGAKRSRMKTFDRKYAFTESGKGFLVQIKRGGELVGIAEIDEIAFPEYIESYLNLMMSISGVCAIAILNARLTEKREQTLELLSESEERFSTTLSSIGDGVIATDSEGRIAFMNQVAEKLTGWKIDEVEERPLNEVFRLINEQTRKAVESPVAMVLRTGQVVELANHTILINKSGNEIPIADSGAPIKDPGNRTTGVVIVFRDDTYRREAEKTRIRLLKEENFTTIGKVAGKIAHDFNNVIGIILGTSQLLLSEDLAADLRRDIEIIMESAKKGRSLTSNLQVFAKDQEPRLGKFDINERLDSLIRSMETDLLSINVNTKYDSNLELLIADADLIDSALINLIQNSIHAMSKTVEPELSLRTYSEENNICIEVEDNGCGIPDKYKEMIFEPSVTLKGSGDITGAYSTDIRGSGYGLPNVKRCLDKHGGTIEFESEMNQGTRFKISLPLIKGEFTPEEIPRLNKQQVVEGKKILIVEDELHYGKILHSLLASFNHDIMLASDGLMAMDYLDNNRFDAVSLDFMLPDMRGIDIYSKIRKTDKDVPIIFVSGNFEFMQSMIDLKKEDPKVDLLAKPFNNVDYVNKIHEWLEYSRYQAV